MNGTGENIEPVATAAQPNHSLQESMDLDHVDPSTLPLGDNDNDTPAKTPEGDKSKKGRTRSTKKSSSGEDELDKNKQKIQ